MFWGLKNVVAVLPEDDNEESSIWSQYNCNKIKRNKRHTELTTLFYDFCLFRC